MWPGKKRLSERKKAIYDADNFHELMNVYAFLAQTLLDTNATSEPDCHGPYKLRCSARHSTYIYRRRPADITGSTHAHNAHTTRARGRGRRAGPPHCLHTKHGLHGLTDSSDGESMRGGGVKLFVL